MSLSHCMVKSLKAPIPGTYHFSLVPSTPQHHPGFWEGSLSTSRPVAVQGQRILAPTCNKVINSQKWEHKGNEWQKMYNKKMSPPCLTLLMLRLLLSKTQGGKDFSKLPLPCHVGVLWIALTEYSKMSTQMPGFQYFFRLLHHLVIVKLATSSTRVKNLFIEST